MPSAGTFAEALRSQPDLRLIAVVPHHPDQDGKAAVYPQHVGRRAALDLLTEAGGERVAVYGVENDDATPVYVHAKTCVIDDVWAAVGSDNFNRRSWTWDSELGIAVIDEERDERAPLDPGRLGDGARRFARHLRLALACEHLGRGPDDVDDLLDPAGAFAAFARSASALRSWHDGDRRARGRLGGSPRPHRPRSRDPPGGGRHPCTDSCTTPTGGRSRPVGRAASEPARPLRSARPRRRRRRRGADLPASPPVPDRPPTERS